MLTKIIYQQIHSQSGKERPRRGPNHVGVDNEMRDCLNEILNENCLLMLWLLFLWQIFNGNWARVSLFKRTALMSDCLLLTLGENTVMFVSPH